MIVIRVELHSAVTKRVTELARMHIGNIGGTLTRGNYRGWTYRGRDSAALDRMGISRTGEVVGHDRLGLHVWHLVRKMLEEMGYVK